jgi:hypothetical protein
MKRLAVVCAVVALSAAAVVIPATSLSAQIPQKMNYQMMLTDADDQPLVEQSVDLTFRIYAQEVSGSWLWTESHNDVTTNSIGVVSLILGSSNPITADFSVPLWLEVEVDGEVLSPRRELVTVPYAAQAVDSEMLGGYDASEYPRDDDLATPGSINDLGNPVDWTKLKGVPVGLADGIDHTGGGGDGHSLDAADGSPADAVYVDTEGNVGVGTTSPQEPLHVEGVIRSGSATQIGGLAVWDGSAAQPVGYLAPVFDAGGGVSLVDENGTLHAGMGPSLNPGGGGALVVMRDDAGSEGFVVDGNYLDTQEPLVRISGSANSATFNMDASGDATVALPSNAINSFELLEEPGVASSQSVHWAMLTGTPTVDAIDNCYIYAPDHGYVLAIATAQAQANHSTTSTAYFAISESPNAFSEHAQATHLNVPSAAPDGYYDKTVAVHALFEVGPGGHTFYFIGREDTGDWAVKSRQFTVVYLPTAYGVVDTYDELTGPDWQGSGSTAEHGRGTAPDVGTPSTVGDSEGRLLEDLIRRLERLERRLDQQGR